MPHYCPGAVLFNPCKLHLKETALENVVQSLHALLGVSLVEASHKGLEPLEVLIVLVLEGLWDQDG